MEVLVWHNSATLGKDLIYLIEFTSTLIAEKTSSPTLFNEKRNKKNIQASTLKLASIIWIIWERGEFNP